MTTNKLTALGSVGALMLVVVVGFAVIRAGASSDDAWETFRKDVEAACLKAAEPQFQTAVATVDPFGSTSYGLALIRGKAKGADTEIAAICVYDKKAKTVEIGGELPTA
jgi:hypothetical protein